MKTILISGASIAGTTLAYWLHRYGFDVTVVERAPAPREGGYAVDVRGPAIKVLKQMGVAAQARNFNCDTLATQFLDARGKRAATMPRGFGVIDAQDIEIMRGDLVRILYDTTRHDVRYQFADSIRALEQHADGVHVTFQHAPPHSFDLVIGADGLHSNVRRLCFGDEAQFMHHLGSYMAIFTAPNYLGLDRAQYLFNAPGRVVSVKSTNGNAELKVVAFFSAETVAFDYRDIPGQKSLTAAAFADTGWELPRLMREMQSAPDFYFDSTSQVRMPRWSQGRVVLVGDAASCPSPLAGQGSSMALVGAYVLAGELAAQRSDPDAALGSYERRTRAFMQQNQEVSAELADGFAPNSSFGIWARNRSMALMRFIPGSHHIMNFFMRGLIRAVNGIALPDYAATPPSAHDHIRALAEA
jgi:2-polyprenyl-6-methoxyphenol hydroxylase-like FAD-dependent oxidoreductase